MFKLDNDNIFSILDMYFYFKLNQLGMVYCNYELPK